MKGVKYVRICLLLIDIKGSFFSSSPIRILARKLVGLTRICAKIEYRIINRTINRTMKRNIEFKLSLEKTLGRIAMRL